MGVKKPVSKSGKAKKPSAVKSAPRRPEAHKSAPASASRKAVAAASAKPATKQAKTKTVEHVTHHAPAVPPRPTTPTPQASKPAIPPMRTLLTPEQEDTDGNEPGSLLAGPRNVKPYVAKRGEQYMGKDQLTHFQHILSNWKRDLMEEVDRTVSHMKDEAANFPDPNDRATQEEEFSLELRTRDRERKLIRKIDEALKRIEDGSYGYCLETGEEIGIKRLEARPVATLSIEAQERRERRERQYGDRDDRYR